jgi:hypothetical protein
MQIKVVAVLLAVCAVQAQAADSCGIRVAKLVAAGDAKQVAAMFTKGVAAEASLVGVLDKVGSLSDLKEVTGPRFAMHSRMSVSQPVAPATYVGAWINAESAKLGPIQLHIASKSATDCTLHAVHFDTDMSKRH